MLDTLGYLAAPIAWFERAERKRGAVFRARTLPYGREVFVGDPAVARAVFASRAMLGGRANVALTHVVGSESVSALDGDAHVERRRALVPVLAAGREALDASRSRSRTERALAGCPASFALQPFVRKIVMEAMLESIFGALTPGVIDLGRRFARLIEVGTIPFAQLGVLPAFRRDWPLSPYRYFLRTLADIDRRLHHEIANTKGGMASVLRGNAYARDDVFTLLGAGYETTATSIAWAFESIALRDVAVNDDTITESLRARPTLPTIRRVATAPFDAAGLRVETGESVVLAVHLLQQKGAFFAFGGGARTCPGMRLAIDHMRGVLEALVPAITLERRRPSRASFRGATLAPARPIIVRRTRTSG